MLQKGYMWKGHWDQPTELYKVANSAPSFNVQAEIFQADY